MDSFAAWLKTELRERLWHSYGSTIIGLLTAVSLEAVRDLTDYLNALPATWAHLAAAALLILLAGWKSDRAVAKADAKAALKAAAVALLLFAAPAYAAGPGVFCLKGCPSEKMKLDAGDTAVSSTAWVGPGLGAPPLVYDGATKTWTVSLSPVLSYGIWWRPPGWTATKSLVGLNFSISGEITGVPQAHVDPMLTLNLMDNIQVGGGIKARFAAPGQAGGISPTFALYWSTSVGGM